MRIISKVEQQCPQMIEKKRVAAYSRVSRDSERLMHSLSAQISYYSELIQRNKDWIYAGVYADEGISGTQVQKRDEFKRMIADCEAGKIDIILTKSISRFARNTVDLLKTVRHLKDIGVEVRFEREQISTFSNDGELMLTILASFAQEESRSISDNIKWSRLKGYEVGKPHAKVSIYGYHWEGNTLIVNPNEAAIVQRIYREYRVGSSADQMVKWLRKEGIKTIRGKEWSTTQVYYVLRNITYTGNMMFQKSYTVDPISKKRKKNCGELTQFMVENTHEQIISMEDFDWTQNEMERRRNLSSFANRIDGMNCFYAKIKCGCCGQNYIRRTFKNQTEGSYYMWLCRSHIKVKGEESCDGRAVKQSVLEQGFTEATGLTFTEDAFKEQVKEVVIAGDELLEYHLNDGREIQIQWKRTDKRKPQKKREPKVREPKVNPNFSCFTGKFKCGCCGKSIYRNQQYNKKGDSYATWKCQTTKECGTGFIYEDVLERTIANVLWLKDFESSAFNEKVDYLTMMDKGELQISFKDGNEPTVRFDTKIRTVKE